MTAVHDVDRTRLDRQVVEDVDVVDRALCQSDKRGDGASQIQQGVQLDCRLGGAKVRPRKQAQAQVDHCGVERVDRLLQFDRERLRGVQLAGSANECLRPIGEDAPVAAFVRVCQRAPHHPPAKPYLIEKRLAGAERSLQIAQALASGKLRERHRQPLVVAREGFYAGVATIAFDAAVKRLVVPEREDLGEYGWSSHGRCESGPSWRKDAERTQNGAHSENSVIVVPSVC